MGSMGLQPKLLNLKPHGGTALWGPVYHLISMSLDALRARDSAERPNVRVLLLDLSGSMANNAHVIQRAVASIPETGMQVETGIIILVMTDGNDNESEPDFNGNAGLCRLLEDLPQKGGDTGNGVPIGVEKIADIAIMIVDMSGSDRIATACREATQKLSKGANLRIGVTTKPRNISALVRSRSYRNIGSCSHEVLRDEQLDQPAILAPIPDTDLVEIARREKAVEVDPAKQQKTLLQIMIEVMKEGTIASTDRADIVTSITQMFRILQSKGKVYIRKSSRAGWGGCPMDLTLCTNHHSIINRIVYDKRLRALIINCKDAKPPCHVLVPGAVLAEEQLIELETERDRLLEKKSTASPTSVDETKKCGQSVSDEEIEELIKNPTSFPVNPEWNKEWLIRALASRIDRKRKRSPLDVVDH